MEVRGAMRELHVEGVKSSKLGQELGGSEVVDVVMVTVLVLMEDKLAVARCAAFSTTRDHVPSLTTSTARA
jgi:hypothetical protein